MCEWDEAKRVANRRKHGVDFAVVDDFDWSRSLTAEDESERYGEARYTSLGPIGDGIYVLVWTERPGPTVRVISLRCATKREKKHYVENVQAPPPRS